MSLEEKFDDIYQRKEVDFKFLKAYLQEFITDDISLACFDFNVDMLTGYIAQQLQVFNPDDFRYLEVDVGLALVEHYIDFCHEVMKRMGRVGYKMEEGSFAMAMKKNPDYDPTKLESQFNRKFIELDGFQVREFDENEKYGFYNKHFLGWEKRL